MRKILMAGVICLVLFTCTGLVSAAKVAPVTVEYPIKPACPTGTIEYKVEQSADGAVIPTDTYDNHAGFSVYVDVSRPDNILWKDASLPVYTVVVKDGKYYLHDGAWANVYSYVPDVGAQTQDSGLSVPPMKIDPAKYGAVSHISFCYLPAITTTTTPTTTIVVPEFPSCFAPVAGLVTLLAVAGVMLRK